MITSATALSGMCRTACFSNRRDIKLCCSCFLTHKDNFHHFLHLHPLTPPYFQHVTFVLVEHHCHGLDNHNQQLISDLNFFQHHSPSEFVLVTNFNEGQCLSVPHVLKTIFPVLLLLTYLLYFSCCVTPSG